MSEIVFAQTRTHYDFRGEPCCVSGSHSGSYTDFWDLVRVSDFPICYIDEIRLDEEKVYITAPVNGETRPHLENERKRVPSPTAKVIWWNLERPASHQEDMVAGAEEITKYVDEVWVSDVSFHAWYKGHPKVKCVIMGSDAALAGGASWSRRGAKTHDVTPLGAPSYHRYHILGQLTKAGLRIGPNRWREARHELLLHSHTMINIHQDELPIGEPLRFALAAAYKMPLLSDILANSAPMVDRTHFWNCPSNQLATAARQLIEKPRDMEMLGLQLHRLLCHEHRFKNQVLRGVGS